MWKTSKRLLQFILLGCLIWLAEQAWQDRQFRVVSAPSNTEILQLTANWEKLNGRKADSAVQQALYKLELDERLLFREALRIKLHRKDPVILRRLLQDARFLGMSGESKQLIETALDLELYQGDELIRRRLVQQMRALAQGNPTTVSDSSLQADYRQFLQNWQVQLEFDFEHKYFRDNAQNETAAQRAQSAAAGLTREDSQQWTVEVAGDPFMHGALFRTLSAEKIDQLFGPEFSQALASVPLRTWSQPIQSSYGWHLVFIDKREQRQPPEFKHVRHRLLAKHRKRTAQERLDAYLSKLQDNYRVITP